MKRWMLWVLISVSGLAGAYARGSFLDEPGLLADYDAEIRSEDGRLDVERMIARLTQLRLDTYFYLIWHRETDWEDLKLFLPAAREAGIDVWAYLVPPSESPPLYGTRYSEPFRLDYVRWAEEIAKLGLVHPNLKAFVIDDFLANARFYTPAYVQAMTERARLFNAEMRFLPLMYYHEIDREFVRDYGPLIDGVVAAYPPDAGAVRRAWRFLNDRIDEPERHQISWPWQTRSAAGSTAAIRRQLRVISNERAVIRFYQRDDYTGPTTGYHFKELLVGGQIAWAEDVGGGDREWQNVTVDVSRFVEGKVTVDVVFRVYDRKGVSNFGVEVAFHGIEFEGLYEDGDWSMEQTGPWRVSTLPAYPGTGRFRIPLVVMIAAHAGQFEKRNGPPATPARIQDKVRMAISQMRNGFAEGVVTYSLIKRVEDPIYQYIRQLFLQTRASAGADFDDSGSVDFGDFVKFAEAFGRNSGRFESPFAKYDLDMDGVVAFGDFILFARAFGGQASSQAVGRR
ncbi:MAG: hypothetical protein OXU79_07975 [Gemmatimonadota bacterium]|nr:hypothetical protein [Gemmatimonadota bacterium]